MRADEAPKSSKARSQESDDDDDDLLEEKSGKKAKAKDVDSSDEDDEAAQKSYDQDSEGDDDGFIVNEDGKAVKSHKRDRNGEGEAVDRMISIFGREPTIEDAQGDDIEDQEEYLGSDDDEYERPRIVKKPKEAHEIYSHDELKRRFLTQEDNLIRSIDIPERIQLQYGGDFTTRQPFEDGEQQEEAIWIYTNAFTYQDNYISRSTDQVLKKRFDKDFAKYQATVEAIEAMVRLLRWETDIEYEAGGDDKDEQQIKVDYSGPRDVPFIAQYRKEEVGFPHLLNMHDLWLISEWDKKWSVFYHRRKNLARGFDQVRDYQMQLIQQIRGFCSAKFAASPDISQMDVDSECVENVNGAEDFRKHNPAAFKDITARDDINEPLEGVTGGLKLVTEEDIEMATGAKTEAELDDIASYMRLHFAEETLQERTNRDHLIMWINYHIGDVMEVKDLDVSWKNAVPFALLVKKALEFKGDEEGAAEFEEMDTENNELKLMESEREVETFALAVRIAKEKLDFEFAIKPEDFILCRNDNCSRHPDRRYVHEDINEGRICVSCKPDEQKIMNDVMRLREVLLELNSAEASRGWGEYSSSLPVRKGIRRDRYAMCKKAGLLSFAHLLGLNGKQIGENLEGRFMKNLPDNYEREPADVAEQFVTEVMFDTPAKVIEEARMCLATEISHDPMVREAVRKLYLERATISVRPTAKGKGTLLEDWNPVARYRYLTHKRVTNLCNEDYLWIMQGEKTGMLSVTWSVVHDEQACQRLEIDGPQKFWEEIESAFVTEEQDHLSILWNEHRKQTMRYAVDKILFPLLENEVKAQLVEEAQQFVIEQCANFVRSAVSRAPFKSLAAKDDEVEDEAVRVLGMCINDDSEVPCFAVMLDQHGDVVDHIKLPFLMLPSRTKNEGDRKRRDGDWESLKKFMENLQPEVIVLGANGPFAHRFKMDLETLVAETDLEQADLPIEYGEMGMPLIYANSEVGQKDHPDAAAELRMAIMLAWRMQKPELAYAALCGQDRDITSLKMHALQDQIPVKDLFRAIEQEIITAINRTGIDLNDALQRPHVKHGLPFIAGLGPRKLIAIEQGVNNLEEKKNTVQTRQQLMSDDMGLGDCVARQCVGFLIITTDDDDEGEGTNPLDRTRIHPSMYSVAEKIAKDALDIVPNQEDDMADDDEGALAVAELLSKPEKLSSMNLEEFAHRLRDTAGYGDKTQTVRDIRAEFEQPFGDTRLEYKTMHAVQLFQCMTGETVHYYKAPADSEHADRDDGYIAGMPPGTGPPPQLEAHGNNELFFHDHMEAAPSLILGQMLTCEVRRVRYRGLEHAIERKEQLEQMNDIPAPVGECCGRYFNGYYSCPECDKPAQYDKRSIVRIKHQGKMYSTFPERVTFENHQDIKEKMRKGPYTADGIKFLVDGSSQITSLFEMPQRKINEYAERMIKANSNVRVVDNLGVEWLCPICYERYPVHPESGGDARYTSESAAHACAMAENEPKCQGQPSGVQVSLLNRLSGQVALRDISDKQLNSPAERVEPGMTIMCRLKKIKLKFQSFELASKTSELKGDPRAFESPDADYCTNGSL